MTRVYLTLGSMVLMALFGPSSGAWAETGEGARTGGLLKRLMERRAEGRAGGEKDVPGGSNQGFYVEGKGRVLQEQVNDRGLIVYVPPSLPAKGEIPLLVVLHGGFGSASQIQKYIGLDPLADQGKFMVAYLDGTKVARGLPDKLKGWNAGGCCGQPYKSQVDDIDHITGVIDYLAGKYGVDPRRVYGTGHSNGGMMTQRIMCETDLYQSAVTIAGTLQMDVQSCPRVSGKHLMNIHGTVDENLPLEGGHTKVGYNKETNYKSQAHTENLFEKSGGRYDLLVVPGADHKPETINAKLIASEGKTLPQKIVEYLGLK